MKNIEINIDKCIDYIKELNKIEVNNNIISKQDEVIRNLRIRIFKTSQYIKSLRDIYQKIVLMLFIII